MFLLHTFTRPRRAMNLYLPISNRTLFNNKIEMKSWACNEYFAKQNKK